MKKLFSSFKPIFRNYFLILLVYFFFYISSGGMENNIPFLFEKRIGNSLYGIFLSLLSIMDVVLPLLIVYFSKKFTPLAVGGLSLLLGAGAAVGISLTENKAVIFAGLFLIYCVRIMFNYSAGNSFNLAVPSEERTGYFALRDIFLYGAIAISTWLSGWLIGKWNMEAAYGFLSVGFLIALVFTWNGRKWIQREEEERIHLKEYIEQIGNVIRDPVVRMFLLTEIATGVYGTILRFIPLLAIAREIEISVFLKYTAVFTVINCICSLFLTLITDRLDKKWVYLFDVGFDILSVALFLIPTGNFWFMAGYCISLLKDMFAPVSFGYLYDCVEVCQGDKNAPVVLGVIESFSNMLNIMFPLVIGALWMKFFNGILVGCSVLLALVVAMGAVVFPGSKITGAD